MHPKITQYLTNDNYYKMGYNYVEMEKKLKYGTVTLTSTFFHLTEVVKVAPKQQKTMSNIGHLFYRKLEKAMQKFLVSK